MTGMRLGSPRVAAVAAALLVLTLCGVVDTFARSAHLAEVRAQVATDADQLARGLSDVVARESAAVETLAAFVEITYNDTQRLASDFPVFAAALMEQGPHIRSVQLAPASILEYVYPLEGNEAARGLDLMADPDRKSLLVPAIDTGETVIQGPVELVQGGDGLLVRRPTYRPDGRFWGFSAVILDWGRISTAAGLRDESDMLIGLRTAEGGRFLEGTETAFLNEPVIRTLRVGATDTRWEIAMRPAGGWDVASPITPVIWIVGIILAAVSAAAGYFLARRPQILRRERQNAINDLAMAEARYQAAFEHVDVGIVISGLAGTIVRANPAFRRIVGLDEGAPLARTVQSYIHPDHLSAHWRRTLELNTTGKPFGHEVRLTRGDTERWCRMRVATMPGDFPGDAVFVAVVEDITERRAFEMALAESETRFRSLFELAPIAIQREDFQIALERLEALVAEGADVREHLESHPDDLSEILDLVRITEANTAASQLQEHLQQNADQLTLGDRLSELALPTYIDTLVAMAEGEETLELEVTTAGADGAPMYLVVRWRVPTVGGERDYSAVLVSIADVTRMRRAERQLEDLLASKDRFLASVAHELRTPLTAVVGFAQELLSHREQYSSEDYNEFLELIGFNSSEMAHLIDDLLVLARADIGEVSVHPSRVDLVALVEESVRTLPGLAATIDVSDREVLSFADSARVRQIVRNLGTNALRYGGDVVEVAVRSIGGHAIIEVSDDGAELTPAEARRIFEPYQRADLEATQPGSIGLGLTVSRSLARLQGGDLVMVREGGRNIFRVSLPLLTESSSHVGAGRVA